MQKIQVKFSLFENKNVTINADSSTVKDIKNWQISNFSQFMEKAIYSQLFTQLNTIQVETNSQHKNQQPFQCSQGFYRKHSISLNIKKQLAIKDNNFIFQAQCVVSRYFSFTLNSAYEKNSKLPKKIFVCGYCKEPFFRPSEYFKHCYLENCPINHKRSTYFFIQKKSGDQITNDGLKKVLSQDQLQKILKIPYNQQRLILSEGELIEDYLTHNRKPKCSICGFSYSRCNIVEIVSHYILRCPQTNNFYGKRIVQIRQNIQNFDDFVYDILNFQLNFNLLSLFNHSYLKLETKVENEKSFYGIFQRSEKTLKNKNESNLFSDSLDHKGNYQNTYKLKFLPFGFKKNNQLIFEFPKLEFGSSEINNRIQENWYSKLNEEYEKLKVYLLDKHFCGVCLNFFSTIQQYFAHCIIYLCPLNYPKSSHTYYSQKHQTPLSIQNIPISQLQSEIKKIIMDERFSEKQLNLIQIQRKPKVNCKLLDSKYLCGLCKNHFQSKTMKKNRFIRHVLTICQSHQHKDTSHFFKIKIPQLPDEQYQKIIINHFYGVKIAEYSFGQKYVLSRNENICIEGNYCCGSCNMIFESREEYVYHSISVCQSLENFKSSHFISKICHPSATIEDPLLNLIEENQQVFQSSQMKKIKKINNLMLNNKRMQIQEESSQVAQQDQSVFKHGSSGQNNFLSKVGIEQNASEKLELQIFQAQEQLQKNEQINRTVTLAKTDQHSDIFQSQQQQDEKIQPTENQSEIKFLRFNFDNIGSQSSNKFYCAKCKVTFKKYAKFIEHLQQQSCKSYENPLSSHFYVTNKRMNKILTNKVIRSRNDLLKDTVFSSNYQAYQPKKSQKVICQCKQNVFVYKVLNHNVLKHGGQNLSGGCHIELRVNFYEPQKVSSVIMMEKYGMNNEDEFVCPCKPWKRMSFNAFMKHVVKRHEGKTPKFYMKLPNA